MLDKAAPDIAALQAALANAPRMAEGGIVNSATMALIGEAGPEAVVPLDRMGSMGNVTYNIYASGIGDQAIAQVVQNALQELNRYGNSTTYAGAL
jgi:SLT domain-containing protein